MVARRNRNPPDPQTKGKVKEPFELVRKCLKCGKAFLSTGRFNRLCENCAESNERSYAV